MGMILPCRNEVRGILRVLPFNFLIATIVICWLSLLQALVLHWIPIAKEEDPLPKFRISECIGSQDSICFQYLDLSNPVRTGAAVINWSDPQNVRYISIPNLSVAKLSPDGRHVAVVDRLGSVYLVVAEKLDEFQLFAQLEPASIRGLHWSLDCLTLLIETATSMQIWSVEHKTMLRETQRNREMKDSMASSPSGRYNGMIDKQEGSSYRLRIHDLFTGQIGFECHIQSRSIGGVQFINDRSWIIWCRNGMVYRFDSVAAANDQLLVSRSQIDIQLR